MNRLKTIAQTVEKELSTLPRGNLRISSKKGVPHYYYVKENMSGNGKYIPKDKWDFAKKLAQRSYDEKVLAYARKKGNQMERLLRNYEDYKIEELYMSENPNRRNLVTPVEEPYQLKLEHWLSISYEGKGFGEESPVILTNGGVRVRSKSEKILADYFESMGIPYKYECPKYLKPFGTVYPDFTFLSRKSGREIYWEHDGMMDKPDYAKKAVRKIELYEKNGIFPGEQLIITYETSEAVINTELIKVLTNRYLL